MGYIRMNFFGLLTFNATYLPWVDLEGRHVERRRTAIHKRGSDGQTCRVRSSHLLRPPVHSGAWWNGLRDGHASGETLPRRSYYGNLRRNVGNSKTSHRRTDDKR